MIEPVLSGQPLLEEIRASCPGPGSLVVWWLGQSGFLIRSGRLTILIDPYLSEHLTTKYAHSAHPHVRMTRAPLRGADLAGIDYLLCSHRHSDHLDPGTAPDVMAGSPDCQLILPASLRAHAAQMNLPADRLLGLESKQTHRAEGISVRAVPSAHETLDTDDEGRHLYLGYVIELDGFRLYHSGDSLAYDGLAEALGDEPFDVLFLPINGRDPARGVPGNMTAAEAVDLGNRVRPRFVVPHHYDMFTFNTVPVGDFETEARRLVAGTRAQVLRCGERWEVER